MLPGELVGGGRLPPFPSGTDIRGILHDLGNARAGSYPRRGNEGGNGKNMM